MVYIRGGRGNLKVRLILGLIVVVIGVISYYAKTQKNPVTGESQRVSLTPEQEIVLGLQAAPQMAGQFGGAASPSDPDARLVREVGEKLVRSSEAARSPYRFNFHLLNDARTINAFALPGGQIFITRGLFDKLETVAQLAGVLGHEIGHVIHRHGAEHLAKSELSQTVSTGLGVAAGDRGAAWVSAYVGQMIQMKYGREDELESDASGLRYLVDAGWDPRAMLGVMKVLKEASGSARGAEIFASHPYPEKRIEQIEAWLAREFPGGVPAHLGSGGPLRLPEAR